MRRLAHNLWYANRNRRVPILPLTQFIRSQSSLDGPRPEFPAWNTASRFYPRKICHWPPVTDLPASLPQCRSSLNSRSARSVPR